MIDGFAIRSAAANRDPSQFGCPADLDPERPNGSRHMAFSLGESHCPGAGGEVHHAVNFTLRAFIGLRVVFDPAS